VLRTDLGAALGDVAVAERVVVLEVAQAVFGVERVHLQRRHMHEEPRADEFVVLVMVTQHVADVLAQEALDALPEFLHPVDVLLRHAPRAVRAHRAFRGLNGLIFFLTSKFHETSVTRSRTCGNARIGSTDTGSFAGSSSMRVMHMSRGWPLISAEQEPHFPALQFQRTARSPALSAWILCMASRTTMPSLISVR
jgi:hypothetical protein